MNREDQLSAEWPSDEDPMLSVGKHIAMQWNVVDAEHFSVAMQALEPELRRAGRERMARLQLQHEEQARAAWERQQERAHRRHMTELTVGAVVALAMLGAGVYVAAEAWWLATLLCGPSLLAVAKVFVLRRSDPDDMRFLSRASRSSTNAAGQGQPPQPPVV
jgi:hypothetical protein